MYGMLDYAEQNPPERLAKIVGHRHSAWLGIFSLIPTPLSGRRQPTTFSTFAYCASEPWRSDLELCAMAPGKGPSINRGNPV